MDPIMMDRAAKYGSNAYRFLIKPEDTLLLVINIQEKFLAAMEQDHRQTFLRNNQALIRTAHALDIPIIASEHMPERFGRLASEIDETLGDALRIAKLKFSCWREGRIMAEIKKTSCKTVIVSGMEAHVCVLQSVMDLLVTGHYPIVATDAVCSRFLYHRETAVKAMAQAGAVAYPTEAIVFMLLDTAGTPLFEETLKLLDFRCPPLPASKGIVNE